MKKITTECIRIMAILSIGLIISSCCAPPKLASVGINIKPQHTNCWCWAACTEMVSEYYGHRILQHESCNFVHGTDCTSDCPGACTCWDWYGATLQQIKNNWTHWDFDYKYIPDCLEWGNKEKFSINDSSYIRNTISTTQFCRRCPIYAIWWWYGGGGHVVVAYGYAEINSQRYISVLNPWPPDCSKNYTSNTCTISTGGDDVVTTYEAFVDDKVHNWGDTFCDFKYTGN